MIFFGTSSISIIAFNRLLELGLKPHAVVTVPDRPAGRKLVMTPPPVKVWAEEHGLTCLQFEKLDAAAAETLKALGQKGADTETERDSADNDPLDIFIVVSYGKIIPQAMLDIPKHGALNLHPSLLPKFRGATPMPSAILADERNTGVTIIQMDKLMDHGPIMAMEKAHMTPWPMKVSEMEEILGRKGAEILAAALHSYMDGTLKLIEQDHDEATYCTKFSKEDGEIRLSELEGEAGWKNFLKFNALEGWPGIYFFAERNGSGAITSDAGKTKVRVKVKAASWNADAKRMEIERVVPEGRNEMTWKDFQNFMK